MIPVNFSGAIKIFPPMPRFNPMVPAPEMNNYTHYQHGTSPLVQQAIIQSEGLDFFGQLKRRICLKPRKFTS